MKPITMIGIVLIVLGVLALAFQGLTYTKRRESVQVGPVEMTATEKATIPPYVGVIALVAGVGLVLAGRRKV